MSGAKAKSVNLSDGHVVSPDPESYSAQISEESLGTLLIVEIGQIISSSSVSGQSYLVSVTAAISKTGRPAELLLASRACCARAAAAVARSEEPQVIAAMVVPDGRSTPVVMADVVLLSVLPSSRAFFRHAAARCPVFWQ